ncbi:MAG: hypothetical protein Q7K55_05445 [Candidatus Levybacteria bacterium]|nr:hypothetical protein [Candidatus Levybacteria bacterium]
MKWILIIVAFFLLILLISNSSSRSSTTTNDSSATSTVNSDDYPDEDIESEQIEENIDTDYDQLEFNGFPCTEDCSGHEAGYEWAEEKGITQDDVDNYSGNSNSFMEGMQSYVDEN